MATAPFVIFRQTATKDIGSTPVFVFGSQYACILDGLIISNQVDNDILFSLYLLREEGEPTPLPVEYPFILNKSLAAKDSLDWLYGKNLTLEAGDTLWAYSDYSDHLFNTMISYRELTELDSSYFIKSSNSSDRKERTV